MGYLAGAFLSFIYILFLYWHKGVFIKGSLAGAFFVHFVLIQNEPKDQVPLGRIPGPHPWLHTFPNGSLTSRNQPPIFLPGRLTYLFLYWEYLIFTLGNIPQWVPYVHAADYASKVVHQRRYACHDKEYGLDMNTVSITVWLVWAAPDLPPGHYPHLSLYWEWFIS